MKRVLLYGTSANPPTGRSGHMGAIEFFLSKREESNLCFDEIWMLPVYRHIYASKRTLVDFEHRVAMCSLAVADLQRQMNRSAASSPSVHVKETEKELIESVLSRSTLPASEIRVGTIDLIRFLLEQSPQIEFSMLLGADTFSDLLQGKWKEGDELFRLIRFVVMERKGCTSARQLLESDSGDNVANNACRQDRVRVVQIPTLGDISSTAARQLRDVAQLKQMLMPSVAEYVVQNRLYAFEQSSQS